MSSGGEDARRDQADSGDLPPRAPLAAFVVHSQIVLRPIVMNHEERARSRLSASGLRQPAGGPKRLYEDQPFARTRPFTCRAPGRATRLPAANISRLTSRDAGLSFTDLIAL